MEWWMLLLLIVGGLIFLMAMGAPVFVAFTIIGAAGAYLLWGNAKGMEVLIHSIFSSISTFVLLPVLMFVLMGELLFHSGVFIKALEVLDMWMGRIPGRLCMLSVGGATLFASLSGSSMGTCAMLGSLLLPEMEKKGYNKIIAIGSCMSGGLAMIIPPSALAVVLGSLMEVSIGRLLMAGIIPGLLIAVMYIGYIVVRCTVSPELAPDYVLKKISFQAKVIAFAKYVLPFAGIILVVTIFVFAGLATPTESAGLGVVASAMTIAAYKKLSLSIIRKSVDSTLRISVMMFMILTGSTVFSQILAFTGAGRGLVELVVSFPLPPVAIILVMQIVMIAMGTFMESVSIMMITLPIFMPILRVLNFDLIVFGLVTLINMEIGMKSPPFGLILFVMKGVVGDAASMIDIVKSVGPFIALDLLVMLLILFVPSVATVLPNLMRH